MDLEVSKENIQPLRGGRNFAQLNVALQAQSNAEYQRELTQRKAEFEAAINSYQGDDPLENWYQYISWVEQSYPKQGHEGNLITLLEHCLGLFENDKRYTHDRRFCKLWIKFIDVQQNPLELYHMMYARGLLAGCADFYKAWAFYHEAAGDYTSANGVFEMGKQVLAQPYDELDYAHKNLILAAGQNVLYGTDERRLQEKRHALISLQTLKPGKVGNVRVAAGGPSVMPSTSRQTPRSNVPVQIYTDDNRAAGTSALPPDSIIVAAKRQEAPKENTMKPGPWTTVKPMKNKIAKHHGPDFAVCIDDDDQSPVSEQGLRMPVNYPRETRETYVGWHVNMTIQEPVNNKMIPKYPKSRVYADPTTEYSIEELRAIRHMARKVSRLQPHALETQQAVQSILGNEPQDSQLHMCIQDISPVNSQPSISVPNKSLLSAPVAPQLPQNSLVHSSYEQPEQTPRPTLGSISSQHHVNPQIKHQTPNRPLLVLKPLFTPPETSDSGSESVPTPSFGGTDQFKIWAGTPETLPTEGSRRPPFALYQDSILTTNDPIIQERKPSQGSAMKTPLKVLNADELAETGSRGGMDMAAAAQPVDSANFITIFDDDSSSSLNAFCPIPDPGAQSPCDTQAFNLHLNAMQVSTPNFKQQMDVAENDHLPGKATYKKQLFEEPVKIYEEEKLSTIYEETKSYSSSSSGATTKSSVFAPSKQTPMATISEEYNRNLEQNLKANEHLRRSLLGDLMDFNTTETVEASAVSTLQVAQAMSIPQSPERSAPPPPAVVQPLDAAPSNPFKSVHIEELLNRVKFPGPHVDSCYEVANVPKLIAKKEAIVVGTDRYVIDKQLGRGTFGVVFKGIELYSQNPVALKYQKPPNKWEYYICRELRSRLINSPLQDRFMDVTCAYFSGQASILVSDFMPYGSLLDLANNIKKKTGKSMKEQMCIYFCMEMLRIVDAMHKVNIIHADIKPDNFLIQLSGEGNITLQLIDFGCSIDMSLYPPNTHFTRKVTTENFICCEMLDMRPWNYHTDIFCVAATVHVLLFDKYMQLKKTGSSWSMSTKLPRYLNQTIWNIFFYKVLNQQKGPADPNQLAIMLSEHYNISDEQALMRDLINIVKNR